MTLAPDEFIRRFLLHVLPKGFHRIRHYGLLASAGRKANIARARELIAAPEPEAATQRNRQCRCRRPDRSSPAMPLLRRPHDHRRDLRARRPRPRARHPPAPQSGPRRHDPEQPLFASQARRRPSPPAAGSDTRFRPLTSPHHLPLAIIRPSTATPPRWRSSPASLPVAAIAPIDQAHHSAPSGTAERSNPHRPKPRPRPRGFLPWRLSDAGPRCRRHHGPAGIRNPSQERSLVRSRRTTALRAISGH